MKPRRVQLDEGILVLPPFGLRDLPAGGVISLFLGIIPLRFETPEGLMAAFLHDHGDDDRAQIFAGQRRQAEAQLGEHYARRAIWWERP